MAQRKTDSRDGRRRLGSEANFSRPSAPSPRSPSPPPTHRAEHALPYPGRTRDHPAGGELDLYPADLWRVFLNLIGNAFYATKKCAAEGNDVDYAPTVTISSKCGDGVVEVRVRDNGTGLGLTLSYETVVQQHGGWTEVSSREGELTEFLVTLPR